MDGIMHNNNMGSNIIGHNFQFSDTDSHLFTEMIHRFPYPVQIYSPDGTLVMVNSAFIKEFNVTDLSLIIGKSNVLKDPIAAEYGILQNMLDAFSGKAAHTTDVKIPVHVIKKFYNIPTENIEAFYQDISTFPLKNQEGEIICVVNILITRRRLYNRLEVDKAIVYIEAHWQDKFHVEEVANAVFLSTAHFSRLFKTITGMTPHDYYMNVKINKVKDALLDTNLSIEEAFARCGIEYHGHYANIFKEKTGLSPSDYRKQILKR